MRHRSQRPRQPQGWTYSFTWADWKAWDNAALKKLSQKEILALASFRLESYLLSVPDDLLEKGVEMGRKMHETAIGMDASEELTVAAVYLARCHVMKTLESVHRGGKA